LPRIYEAATLLGTTVRYLISQACGELAIREQAPLTELVFTGAPGLPPM
jgi:hypothetical protein